MLVQREVANNTRTYPTDKYKLNTQGVYTKSQIDQDLSNIYQTMSTKANSADVYYLPDGGIPDTDMSAPVQTSLEKANTAIQEEDIFIAEYGVTTYADISAAYDEGKAVFVKDGNYMMPLTFKAASGIFYFSCINYNDYVWWGYINTAGTWVHTGFYVENRSNNKKNTITGNESSTTYYPTTKAVADYVNDIVGDISDILDEINGEVI